MCGIAGIFSPDRRPVLEAEIRAMCAVMVHRGPDDEGVYLAEGLGLGMRRLSIIDVAHGHQPISNEDGTVHAVVNGEIYNFRELRQALKAKGHRFRTSSDSEVIVHLYEEYGTECIAHLRGMFGLAVWDVRRQRLLLARDRVGIKPLYWTEAAGGRLAFASELKSLLQLPDLPRALNWPAVDHLFAHATTAPAESIIAGVHKLEPGHLLIAERGAPVKVERYWSLRFEADHDKPESRFVDELRDLLEESVRLHMVSDVPVGAFLSGGIDSSAVVATMGRESTNPVNTFSIGFHDSAYDESSVARRTAEALGTRHREWILDTDALDVAADIAWHLDEPFGDSSAIPTWMVSKMAAEHVTVALSGDGGDELFGGYDRYLVEANERWRDRIPAPLRALSARVSRAMPEGAKGKNYLHHLSLKGFERYLHGYTLFEAERRQQLFTADALAALGDHDVNGMLHDRILPRDAHWLDRLQYFDINHYLPLDILTKVDRMSMAHSLEVRVPLLDHKLVEFAATVPPAMRIRNGTTKSILKKAMRGIVPDEVIDRPKRGFAVPVGDWFRGGLAPFVRELLLSDRSRARGVVNAGYVERLLTLHEGGRTLDTQLWTLISFELWCRAYLDAPAPVLREAPVYAVR
ncbi:MAG: asparagine synthase (glutamine-hydrolyzing) [Xanthomonadaceae bacterium]|nr:asparagine synthase (glutamine-hydrolyzing) [Xanthomonadaceae bacterium]